MKDKGPVIIHDVDVRDCEYFRWFDSRCSLINCQYGGGHPSCENIPNCQYKKLTKELNQKIDECDELKERLKCNCFDPKSNNNRCISYNRIAEDYEMSLTQFKAAYTKAYTLWSSYIANGVYNASDKVTQMLLYDLGSVTKMLSDLSGIQDNTVNHYISKGKTDGK